MHQLSLSDEGYTYKKKTTRKEHFLCEVNAVLPWADLLQPIMRQYPKPGQGRRPIAAETMLRIYFLQQWYGLVRSGYGGSSVGRSIDASLCGVGLDAILDETTLGKFRHFLERHGLTEILVLYGDKAYVDAQRRQDAQAEGIQGRVLCKATRGRKLTCADHAFNPRSNRTRTRVKHPFGVIKHLWGYRKVRYRDLAKNAAQAFTLFALANVYLARRELRTT